MMKMKFEKTIIKKILNKSDPFLKKNMTKIIYNSIFLFLLVFFAACSKSSDQNITISSKEFSAGVFIDNGYTLNTKNGSNGRSIKGTLKAGQIYYLSTDFADATINNGDTLVIQSGVQVLIVGQTSGVAKMGTQNHAPALVINGTFLCLGTKSNPNIFNIDNF